MFDNPNPVRVYSSNGFDAAVAGQRETLGEGVQETMPTSGSGGVSRRSSGAKKGTSRKRFDVVKTGPKTWSVKTGCKTVSNHRTQGNAVKEAARRGNKSKPSQQVIHRPNGRIREERTYGGDPRRSKG